MEALDLIKALTGAEALSGGADTIAAYPSAALRLAEQQTPLQLAPPPRYLSVAAVLLHMDQLASKSV